MSSRTPEERLRFYKSGLEFVQQELEHRKLYNSPTLQYQELSTETLEDDRDFYLEAIQSIEEETNVQKGQ